MSKALRYLTAAVILSCGIAIGLQLGRVDGRQVTNSSPGEIGGATYRMERAYQVAVHVPNAGIEPVLKSVVSEGGLEYGKCKSRFSMPQAWALVDMAEPRSVARTTGEVVDVRWRNRLPGKERHGCQQKERAEHAG